MNKSTATVNRPQAAQPPATHLKDPALAAFLAWLIPGLGHFYQGRRSKGAMFMICILGTFFYGLYLGEGRVVYAAWKPEHRRLPYLCQVGAGLPALPALVQSFRVQRGDQPIGDFMTPPDAVIPLKFQRRAQNPVQTWSLNGEHRRLHRFFELGTVYTMIAGLLNILVIYDAWGGPAYAELGRASPRESSEGSGDKKGKGSG